MSNRSECPKCGGTTEDGFVADFRGGHGLAVVQSAWYPGKAEQRRFQVAKVKVIKATSLAGSARREIVANRCRNCGFIEQYAP